jgi:oligopeptide transport system substrate-binding protein
MSDPAFQDQILTTADAIGTEFLIFNKWLAPTDDFRVRKALSLAIDKEAAVATLKAGIPAPYFVHPGVTGGPKEADYPELGFRYNPEEAKALIEGYRCELLLQHQRESQVVGGNYPIYVAGYSRHHS